MKRLLPLIVGLSLVSCDSGTKEAEGTSSETQTALQALADSLYTVILPNPGKPEKIVPARSRYLNVQYPGERIDFIYGWDGQKLVQSNVIRRTDRPKTYIRDTYFGDSGCQFRVLQEFEEGNQVDLRYEGDGISRSGFRFRWSLLRPQDAFRYGLDSSKVQKSEYLIYQLGGSWDVVVAPSWGAFPDRLPIHSRGGGERIGTLVRRDSNSIERPILDWSSYQVVGLDGLVRQPRMLDRMDEWIPDSLGLFSGEPKFADDGTTLEIPYRWKFFPGTSELLLRAPEFSCGFKLFKPNELIPDSISFVRSFRPASDEGADTLRIESYDRYARAYGPIHMRWPSYSDMDSAGIRMQIIFDLEPALLPVPEAMDGHP